MTYIMGIDGGGSTIRVVIVTPDLSVIGQSQGPTVSPSVVGAEAAAKIIQNAIHTALHNAALSSGQITAAGIGIAGAAASHSATWLHGAISPILPDARIVLSADYEIALIGAMGERCGVLILSGTGSLAYGVNTVGKSALVGGWGYLLGDEGSGYWIGLEGLRAVIRANDGSSNPTILTTSLLNALSLPDAHALIPWLYHSDAPRTREIAALAPFILEQAQQDATAGRIARQAAHHLASMARTAGQRLGMESPSFAFAGGILTTPNPVSVTLCNELGISAIPEPRHPPVIGAALLALLDLHKG